MESSKRLIKKLKQLKSQKAIYDLNTADLQLVDEIILELEASEIKKQTLSKVDLARIISMILRILLDSSG